MPTEFVLMSAIGGIGALLFSCWWLLNKAAYQSTGGGEKVFRSEESVRNALIKIVCYSLSNVCIMFILMNAYMLPQIILGATLEQADYSWLRSNWGVLVAIPSIVIDLAIILYLYRQGERGMDYSRQ